MTVVDKTWKWKHFDKRTSDKYLDKGIISQAEMQSHLKALPDETENATWVELEMDETEIGSDLDDDIDLEAEEEEVEADGDATLADSVDEAT